MFELFRIGFLTVTFADIIDICIVTFIIYKLYTLLKGTIAAQIFVGLMIILLISFISQAANFRALSWLLKLITDIWVIAFLILFQPEIRRLLVMVARNPMALPQIPYIGPKRSAMPPIASAVVASPVVPAIATAKIRYSAPETNVPNTTTRAIRRGSPFPSARRTSGIMAAPAKAKSRTPYGTGRRKRSNAFK